MTGKDKLIYDTIIEGFYNGISVMDIHRKYNILMKVPYLISNKILNLKCLSKIYKDDVNGESN